MTWFFHPAEWTEGKEMSYPLQNSLLELEVMSAAWSASTCCSQHYNAGKTSEEKTHVHSEVWVVIQIMPLESWRTNEWEWSSARATIIIIMSVTAVVKRKHKWIAQQISHTQPWENRTVCRTPLLRVINSLKNLSLAGQSITILSAAQVQQKLNPCWTY